MNKNIKTTIDTIGTVVNVMTDNLTTYANEALNRIKNMKPDIESEVQPVLGYETGQQGWYDTLGGGPCNKYCRYTGNSPNVQWTCSDEKDLSKLTPIPKDKSGRFCYGYDKKTKKPIRTGAVINGTFVSSQNQENNIEDSGNYNFVIYNNKNADGIENFENNANSTTDPRWSGPELMDYPGNDITSFNINNVSDCGTACFNTASCTGFIVDDASKFCWLKNNLTNQTPNSDRNTYRINKNPTSTNPKWYGPEKSDYPYNDLSSFAINQVSDCGNACYNNNQCVGFVTTDGADYCWLKSNLANSNPSPDRNTYRVNRNPQSTDPRWTGPEMNTVPMSFFKGKSINSLNNISPSKCGELCSKNSACKGFITDNAGDTCNLLPDLSNSIVYNGINTYTMKSHYDTVPNVSLKECENLCQNNDNCKGFNYDSAKKSCAISGDTIKPVNFDTNSVSGNKKVHMALNGTYNIYQNNSCVNSTLFNNDANVTASLGIITNDNGVPIIPKNPVCPNNLNNNFIFGKNYEIMALDTDIAETDTAREHCGFLGFGCHMRHTITDQTVNDARCLQVNPDNSVTKENCVYTDNQKWTYDNNISSIRTWDGNCLNVDTSGQNIKVSVKPCVDEVNQKFYLKSVAENMQPKNFNVLDGFGNLPNDDGNENYNLINDKDNYEGIQTDKIENFATNTNVNDYLSENRKANNYLYKLPYSTPFVKNVNDIKENFESDKNNTSIPVYLLYLIVLILLLVILIKKN